ncbi:MAG TPA: tetratricopeptide repeat protein [Methanothermococcus okinawensis]|nr:tetratricopeptide repeat protein [Methanothermococcus okinawensis]
MFRGKIEYYDKVLEINPRCKEAWNNKGIALSRLGRYEEAIECYDRALEIDPKNSLTWYNKGVALQRLGRYSEAQECFNMAERLK